MPLPNQKKLTLALQARSEAVSLLIAEYQQEYNQLHAQARLSRGLPPYSAGRTAEEIQQSIARAEKQLVKWRAQLGAKTNGIATTV